MSTDDVKYEKYRSMLAETRTVIDVKTQTVTDVTTGLTVDNEVIQLIFPAITLLYYSQGVNSAATNSELGIVAGDSSRSLSLSLTETKTETDVRSKLYSQPQLPTLVQEVIVKVIEQTLAKLQQPTSSSSNLSASLLPHVWSTMRHIYLTTTDHEYSAPDVATTYLLQQALDYNDDQLIQGLLFNPAKLSYPRVYPKSLTARMRQYKFQVYPNALIDMYYDIDNILNTFSWIDPNVDIEHRDVATFGNAEQVHTQNLWLDLPDNYFPETA